MKIKTFQSTKVFDGFSACFRQWRAKETHCKFLHGYGVSFQVWFEGELDKKNWVWDFGGMKRAEGTIEGKTPNDFFKWLLDHTVLVAEDDPYLDSFELMDNCGLIQLRTLPSVGAERFAEYLFDKIDSFVKKETSCRVFVSKLEFKEHDKNSAIVYRR